MKVPHGAGEPVFALGSGMYGKFHSTARGGAVIPGGASTKFGGIFGISFSAGPGTPPFFFDSMSESNFLMQVDAPNLWHVMKCKGDHAVKVIHPRADPPHIAMIGASIMVAVASAAAITLLLTTCSGGEDDDIVDDHGSPRQDTHSFVELAILQLKSGGKVCRKSGQAKSPVNSSRTSARGSARSNAAGAGAEMNVLEIHSKPKPETAAVKKY
ncbi:hypothetical protein TTRE_0000851701 [Trichuris trichiura]|uniref:Uncharacterized protein n=1 Tax=Trichuris trichiura TaxID=36087 RepID=A0A077ZNB2_TRITR|nr:hypothetical protein TTRE_0000851701 [Trichuris trichiura]